MTDTPPDWVLLEAAKRSKLSNDTPRQRAILFDTNPSFRALCDMILEHEATKPDPLVAAMKKAGWGMPEINAKELRAALGAVGFEIREKEKAND